MFLQACCTRGAGKPPACTRCTTMAKTPTAAAAPTVATNTNPTTAVNAGPQYRPVPGTLAVKPGLTYKGARAAWYAVLCAHNGQPANNYLAACATKPPSLPASGRAESPTGWLATFVRWGVCTVVPPGQPVPPTK